MNDPHLLLQESAWLHRLAGSLCGDRQVAEDLSQEAMLAMWQSRSRIAGPLRPWLAGTVRRLASNRRRAEARRRRRENAVAVPGSAPAVDEVVARAHLHRSVVIEVMALHEPFRTALLLHYFDNLSCREIAARLGEPIETVRTRIKRGVGMLRSRLDRQHGTRAAWLVPLSAMAEFTTTGATIGASTLAWMVFLMNAKLAAAVAVTLAVTLGILFWPGDSSLPQRDGHATAVANVPAVTAGDAKALPAPVESSEDRNAPDRERVALGTNVIAVTGRVLFARDDSPAAGVEVTLVPAPDAVAEPARTDAKPPATEMLATEALATETLATETLATETLALARAICDADGRYRISLAESKPFICIVRADGTFPVTSHPRHLQLGTEVDLGTIRLHDAIELRGRVRDTGDDPVAGLELNVGWLLPQPANDRWQPETDAHSWSPAVSEPDGNFRVGSPVPGGDIWITLGDASIQLTKDRFAVSRDLAFLDIVVERDLGTIRGVVTDNDGDPQPGLEVNSDHCSCTTDSAGRFELHRRRGTDDRVALRVWRSRFGRSELLHETATKYPWGTDDVRVALPPDADLHLQVVQAPGMQPVEVFDLDMQRTGARAWVPGGVSRKSGASGQRHEDGVIELPGLVPGHYRVLVVQQDHSVEVPFEVFAGERRQQLVLPPHGTLQVELVDAAEQPVAGVRCDVFAAHTELHRDAVVELKPKHGGHRGGATALPWPQEFVRITGGVSSARGTLTLPIPMQGELWLRVCADDHAPQLPPVVFGRGTMRVVLREGATLTGRLEPESVARSLHRPHLFVRSVAGPTRTFPVRYPAPDDTSQSMRADGTFELRGVPAGDWQVCLGYLAPGRGGAQFYQTFALQTVAGLESGSKRDLVLDGVPIAPVRTSGIALRNGSPARFARIDFSGVGVFGARLWGSADCDADGRFQLELAPGTYGVAASVLEPSTRENLSSTVAGQVVVVPGRPCELTLDLVPAGR